MAKKKKLCEICGENPATVPDMERMGRLINRVCSSCHALRLVGDMKLIFELHERQPEPPQRALVERSVRPHVVPITLKQAREFVAAHHRHNKPPADLRCCANCAHWHKKEYIHCQCSGPWGGSIFGDKNCTFRARKEKP